MLMSQHLSDCKRNACQRKSDNPDSIFMNRVDIAARLVAIQFYLSFGGDSRVAARVAALPTPCDNT